MNVQVANEAQARQLLLEARPEMKEFVEHTEESYSVGFELHNAETSVGHELPHIMWKD